MKDITLNHSGGNIKAEFAIEVNYTKKKTSINKRYLNIHSLPKLDERTASLMVAGLLD